MGRIQKVLLMQPNYSIFGKRIWKMVPYSLGLLNASIKPKFNSDLFDPNFENLDDETIIKFLRESSPDVVGVSSVSTEYYKETEHITKLIKKALPNSKIILGGALPTVTLKASMRDRNIDYWFIGEGEKRFLKLLEELDNELGIQTEGIAYYKNDLVIINHFKEEEKLVQDLDSIPFPDYGSLDIIKYGNKLKKCSAPLVQRQSPFIITSTSRGCPFNCTFCSGWTVAGKKVRMRSAENVLEEIDKLYNQGFREIIFLDDHFLFDKIRAKKIMEGIIERNYNLIWKCLNLNVSDLDEEILDLMKKSGSYQMTVSIESGNEKVLREMIKKPFIDLNKVPIILDKAKKRGFEIIANFLIGYPEETWEQIRDTFRYAEKLNIDYAIFHIATPLPGTELMKMCIEKGVLKNEVELSGFCQPIISTKEFTIQELKILRAFEWDRINFCSEERKRNVARMQGINSEELEQWRKDTRRKLGVKIV